MRDDELDGIDALILPDALLKLILADHATRPQLHVVGNQAGIVSLANVLRWLAAGDRESLSLMDLPFVWSMAATSLSLRRITHEHDGRYGVVQRIETQTSFEWLLDAAQLPRLADSLNLLAAVGAREGAIYDAPGVWDAAVHLRVDDTLDGA